MFFLRLMFQCQNAIGRFNLWCSTYGYQGLWGVRLGSVRLGSEKPDHLVIIFYFRFYFYFELGFCYFSGERVRTTKIRRLKVKKNIENLKRIRTLKRFH